MVIHSSRPRVASPLRDRRVWLVTLMAAASGCAHCSSSSDDGTVTGDGPRAGRCGDPYPDQRSSPYNLPWRAGLSFTVGQGNCTDGSHEVGSDDAFAYDIDMPIGTELVAARRGTVLSVEESFADGNRTPGEENYVNVVHEDRTVSVYYHLTRDGVLVAVGEQVSGAQEGTEIAREHHLGHGVAVVEESLRRRGLAGDVQVAARCRADVRGALVERGRRPGEQVRHARDPKARLRQRHARGHEELHRLRFAFGDR